MKPPQSPEQSIPTCRNWANVAEGQHEWTSADVEREHTEGESWNGLPSRDIAQECRDGMRKVKLKLVKHVRKNRKGFLKYNSNKRKAKENVGPPSKRCRRPSDKEGVKALSIFVSAFSWKVYRQASTSLEHSLQHGKILLDYLFTYLTRGWSNTETMTQWGCAISVLEDMQNWTGHGPEQPHVVDPALDGWLA